MSRNFRQLHAMLSLLISLACFLSAAITVTLQMPQLLEAWSNDQVLHFVHFMWKQWSESQADLQRQSAQILTTHDTERPKENANNEGAPCASQVAQTGPASPATVVAAAKKALAVMGEDAVASFHTEAHEREVSETSPLVPANATLLERTQSGTLRVPPIVESHCGLITDISLDASDGKGKPKSEAADAFSGPSVDPLRRNRNLEWLRVHFRSLNEVANLPFNSADLWQLHQHFFSPVLPPTDSADSPLTSDAASTEERSEEKSLSSSRHLGHMKRRSRTPQCSPMPRDASKRANLGRTISFQMLGEATLSASSSMNLESIHKRRSVHSEDEEDEYFSTSSMEPANKRAKVFKPRIAYYPRIRVSVLCISGLLGSEFRLTWPLHDNF